MFETLYRRYDERYVYSAPALTAVTKRVEWEAESPAFANEAGPTLDYSVRLAN